MSERNNIINVFSSNILNCWLHCINQQRWYDPWELDGTQACVGLGCLPPHPIPCTSMGWEVWRRGWGYRQGHSCCKGLCRHQLVASAQRHTLSTLHHPTARPRAQVAHLGTQQTVKALLPRDVLEVPWSCSVLPRAHRAQLHPDPPTETLGPEWSTSMNQGLIPRVIHDALRRLS